VHLPFPDGSQDTVFSSHSYEHIGDYGVALREWYRVLRVGGFIVVFVPHKYLYERKSTPPSLFNPDHKRFYTAASLLREFEESLPANGFRIRHLAENDFGFDYSTPIGEHAHGCYEIELVVEKIRRPAHSDLFELPADKQAQLERIHRSVAEGIAAALSGKKPIVRSGHSRLSPTFRHTRSSDRAWPRRVTSTRTGSRRPSGDFWRWSRSTKNSICGSIPT